MIAIIALLSCSKEDPGPVAFSPRVSPEALVLESEVGTCTTATLTVENRGSEGTVSFRPPQSTCADLEPFTAGAGSVSLPAGGRATLAWNIDVADFGKPQARALVNLAYLTAGALPMGGEAVVSASQVDGRLKLQGRAEGARARLKAEAATGLAGHRLTEGLAGQWIQPYWLWLTVDQTGGALHVEAVEGRVVLTADLPA